MKFRFALTLMLVFATLLALAQKKVEILHANTLEYSKKSGIEAKRLLGDVVFRHDEIYMFCDSAYFYDETNSVQAYNNVRFKQGDTILLIGKYAEYDGDIRMAKMRDSVIMQHNKSYLITDSLDYDRDKNLIYYFEGGRMYDGDNRLRSQWGYYYTETYDYYAVEGVVLKNPDYSITSDTLRYNTETEIADFFGPTEIVSDSNYLYCEYGRYNTVTDEANLTKNAWLQSGSNYLYGDSLYYDRKIRFGEGFLNVSIIDTSNNMIASGNYGYFYEEPERAFMTDSTLLTYVMDGDSLFIHADTIFITTEKQGDTLDFKLMRAFHKVLAFKSDGQARCDSIAFHSNDSIAELFYSPIMWSDNMQATAEYISVKFVNKEPDSFVMKNSSFLCQHIEDDYYNQINCKNINGYLKDKKLYRTDLFSDCQTIYYIEDEEENEFIAQNKLLSSNMRVFYEDKTIKDIMFFEKPEGLALPMDQITDDKLFLKNFKWFDSVRPKEKNDIFVWKEIEGAEQKTE